MSDAGRVRNAKGMVLRLYENSGGYFRAALWRNGKMRHAFIHHLVAEAFIGQRPADRECNHIDGDKANNAVGNLEWVTKSMNGLHAYRVLHRQRAAAAVRRGATHHASRLTDDSVRLIRELRASGWTLRALGLRFGVSGPTIHMAATGQTWAHVT